MTLFGVNLEWCRKSMTEQHEVGSTLLFIPGKKHPPAVDRKRVSDWCKRTTTVLFILYVSFSGRLI